MADFFGFGNDDGGDDFFSKLTSQTQPQSQPSFDLNPFNDISGFGAPPIPPEPLEPSQCALQTLDFQGNMNQEVEQSNTVTEPEPAPFPEAHTLPLIPEAEDSGANVGDGTKETDSNFADTRNEEPTNTVDVSTPQEAQSEGSFGFDCGDENSGDPDEKIIPGEAYVVNEFSNYPSSSATIQTNLLHETIGSRKSEIDKDQSTQNEQKHKEPEANETTNIPTQKQSAPNSVTVDQPTHTVPQAQHISEVTDLETDEENKEHIPEEKVKIEESLTTTKNEHTPRQQDPLQTHKVSVNPMTPATIQMQATVKVTDLEANEEKKEDIKETCQQTTKQLNSFPVFKTTTTPAAPQVQTIVKVTDLEVNEEKNDGVIKGKTAPEESTTTKNEPMPKQTNPPQIYKVPMMSSVPTARPVYTPKRPRMFIPTMPAIPTIPKAPPTTTLSPPSPGPTQPSAVRPQAEPLPKGGYMSILSDMPRPPPPLTPQGTNSNVATKHTEITEESHCEETEQRQGVSTVATSEATKVSTVEMPLPQSLPSPKQPRAGVSFGFGGRMLRPAGKGFSIVSCESAMKSAIPRDIYEFPGPLLYGKEQSMTLKVKAFIYGKIQQKRKEPGKEAEALLWELMELLLEKPNPSDNLLAPENRKSLIKLLAKYRGYGHEIGAARKPPRSVRETASDEVERLYAEERYEEALCLALEEGCVCQAIIISQKVPGGAEVLARRVASDYLPNGDPTKLGFMLSTPGFKPTDLFRKEEAFTKSLTDNWITTIMEVAKTERIPLMHKRAIVGELGDRIWAEGRQEAATMAHVCYLIADFGFGAPQDVGTRIALVGWDHIARQKRVREDFLSVRFLESFELTEIYEFLFFTRLFKSNGGTGSIDEQRYKFFCGFQMRKFEFLKNLISLSYEKFGKTGINYINSINGMISKFFSNWSVLDPVSFRSFKSSFNEYAKRIKVYITAPTAKHMDLATTQPQQNLPQTPSPSVSPTASLVSKIQQSSSSWFGWMMNKK